MITEDVCTDKVRELARQLYEAYIENSGGKAWDGRPCPAWDDLGTNVRSHWCAAALVVPVFEPKEGCITAQVTSGHAMVKKGDEVALVPMDDIKSLRAAYKAVPTNEVVPKYIALWVQPLVNAVTQILHPGSFEPVEPEPVKEPS